MKGSKSFGKDSSVSMDPVIPGVQPLEVEDLSPELSERVASSNNDPCARPNTDQLLIAAIRDSIYREGRMVEGRISILPVDHSNVEVLLHLPNVKPVTKGVFRLV